MKRECLLSQLTFVSLHIEITLEENVFSRYLACSSIKVTVNVTLARLLSAVQYHHLHYLQRNLKILGGGADKSLARPTLRCRRTKSIVSLERGVCSCAELQVFSCYRG
jgi:hypothetical protein